MSCKNLHVAIMAGGLGKQMNSDLPKVLQAVNNVPMIILVIRTALTLNPVKIWIIIEKYSMVSQVVGEYFTSEQLKLFTYVNQESPLGTGDAVRQILPYAQSLSDSTPVLILSGDVPLIQTATLNQLLGNKPVQPSLLCTLLKNPTGNGRLILDTNERDSQSGCLKDNNFDSVGLKGKVISIIEEKDCTSEQKSIQLINCGTYVFPLGLLRTYLPRISNHNQSKEYYLTDLIHLISQNNGPSVIPIEVPVNLQYTLHNVNTVADLNYILFAQQAGYFD